LAGSEFDIATVDPSLVDPAQISRFLTSIFWRLSVYRRKAHLYGLGKYESEFRRYLLSDNAHFPEHGRLVVTLLDRSPARMGEIDRGFGTFSGGNERGYRVHRFMLLGVDARLCGWPSSGSHRATLLRSHALRSDRVGGQANRGARAVRPGIAGQGQARSRGAPVKPTFNKRVLQVHSTSFRVIHCRYRACGGSPGRCTGASLGARSRRRPRQVLRSEPEGFAAAHDGEFEMTTISADPNVLGDGTSIAAGSPSPT
jgi:hypothetical protein